MLVTGHIHDGLPEAVSHDGRVLVRVKGYGEELGRLDLKVDTEKKAPVAWTWKHIPSTPPRSRPPPDVAAAGEALGGRGDRACRPAAGGLQRAFTKAEVKTLIEQAMRDETGADFAFMNLGGVRDGCRRASCWCATSGTSCRSTTRWWWGRSRAATCRRWCWAAARWIPDREYTLAVSDFTAANQGTAENLRTTGLKFPHDVGLMRDLLIDWFRKKKVIE